MELNMNAVERISHYSKEIPVEEDNGDVEPEESWPEEGSIQFEVK